MSKYYEVVEFTQKGKQTVIATGLTEREAQKICSDPEASSMTAMQPKGCDSNEACIERWHKQNKHWFYGYRSSDKIIVLRRAYYEGYNEPDGMTNSDMQGASRAIALQVMEAMNNYHKGIKIGLID